MVASRFPTRFVYELAWAGEGEAGAPFVMGLIDVDALRGQRPAQDRYDDERSGSDGDRSAPGRGAVGPRSVNGGPLESTKTAGIVRPPAPCPAPSPETTPSVAGGERRSYAHAAR
ncbi:hypothetical protein [Sphingomonas sp. PP-F2F-G114-C0414]|uniref:hypothetical protein n=1 Tax=Sphingomonas sp. PP-F2F-G114-C0414 TaxID=2135662 RepID=UPI000EF8826C|nr:hypothetical protein [Sphingomonas sp. PP-F2F-G114-C0414]